MVYADSIRHVDEIFFKVPEKIDQSILLSQAKNKPQ